MKITVDEQTNWVYIKTEVSDASWCAEITGRVEPKGPLNQADQVNVNWSAIGSVDLATAREFAAALLATCDKVEEIARAKGLLPDATRRAG